MYPLAIWPKAGIAIRFLFSMYLFLEKKLEIREGNFCSNRLLYEANFLLCSRAKTRSG